MKRLFKPLLPVLILGLALAFLAPVNLAEARPGGQSASYYSYSSPELRISPHAGWNSENVFKSGKGDVKDAALYAFTVTANDTDGKLTQVGFTFDLRHIATENIGNIRIIADANGNGKVDADEIPIGGTEVRYSEEDKTLTVVFTDGIEFKEDEIQAYILAADIAGAVFKAQIIVSFDSGSTKATKGEDDFLSTTTKGEFIAVEHYLARPLAAVKLNPTREYFVGMQKVELRGIVEYLLGVEIDEKQLKALEIEGWTVEDVILGPEQGENYHFRTILVVLSPADEKMAFGEAEVPSFEIGYFNKATAKKQSLRTPTFRLVKVPYYVQRDVFTRAVSIGDEIHYNIDFVFGDSIELPDSYLDKLKTLEIKDFNVKAVNIDVNQGPACTQAHINIVLSFTQVPGKAVDIEAVSWTYVELGAEGKKIEVMKLDPVQIKVDMVTQKGDRLRPQVKLDGSDDLTLETLSVTRLVLAGLVLAFLLWFPARGIWLLMKRRAPAVKKAKIKRKFWKMHAELEKDTEHFGKWSLYQKNLNEYLSVLLKLDANPDSIGFGAVAAHAARSKAPELGRCWNDISSIIFTGNTTRSRSVGNILEGIKISIKNLE